MAEAPDFAYLADTHDYRDLATGVSYPSITQMLETCGHLDTRWYTPEAAARGSAIHARAEALDRGQDDPGDEIAIAPYITAYRRATGILRPVWAYIEVPFVHPEWRFGGTPDRVGQIAGAQAVLDLKAGGAEAWHALQTALQAILVAPELRLPAETLVRYALYLTTRGTFRLSRHRDATDFDEARRIIRRCCAG